MKHGCLHCGKRRGSRHCPALGGPICSRCCGENRLLWIACSPSCPHLQQHETFQREKRKARYREAWVRINADLRNREEDLQLGFALEGLLGRAVEQIKGLTDADVATALTELSSRLSPIELVAYAPSPLGRALWEALKPPLKEGKLPREKVKDGLTRLAKVVEALREPEAPRAFLQGLFAHLNEILPQEPGEERKRLIITPDELRRLP